MRLDADLVLEITRQPSQQMAQYFADNCHRFQDDANYWNVLGTLWKLGGTVHQQDLWIPLFQSKRSKRHKIMKSHERRMWRKLPNTVVAYRAVNNTAEASYAISWSLNAETAWKRFSFDGQREVVSREFTKPEILAYFDRRQEEEIIVAIWERASRGLRCSEMTRRQR